jgi:phosphoribosylaminoimidazolecarboxamide formyltransferase/IMP cyclohydrolase
MTKSIETPSFRVLIYVHNKTGIIELARKFRDRGGVLVSTRGTANLLGEAGVPCTKVEDITGFPGVFGGRGRVLHPKVLAGIMADSNDPHGIKELSEHGIEPFDMVIANLRPIESRASSEDGISSIDLIVVAAMSWESTTIVIESQDYAMVSDMLADKGEIDRETRFKLAQKALVVLSEYLWEIGDSMSRGNVEEAIQSRRR